RAFVGASGKGTAATLFPPGNTEKVGIIGMKDGGGFGEVGSGREDGSKLDATSIGTVKNYMAQGSYSKDGVEFTSTCSIVLSGNIKTDIENRCPLWDYRHLFQPLPEELREDTAFLDRV